MKFFILSAIVAMAAAAPDSDAKADPAYLYNYGYASPYATTYGYNAAYGVAPYGVVKPAYYNAAYPYVNRVFKREAEAEPEAEAEADPAYLYGAYSGYAAPVSTYAAYKPTYYGAYAAHPVAAYTGYTGYNGYRVFKREAEAEAEPQYGYGYGNGRLAYNYPTVYRGSYRYGNRRVASYPRRTYGYYF
ncbi:shematrin-like protein 1 [Tigriopus californicus]|uniref:shematrin-like protein 1 n=1 Tax=Tigriopus californicus TaxID=6832 RepID=UPI0027DA8BA5|nr:shematrin-like protein 1 [Tigriopus californicus]